ncbi:PTS cellobiose transporter subunit IIC [Thermoflavimicrobium daqui]|uniref:Permease IIC component n=1 Tax=Thermoflavimicrobium daqui TaxID=2137476 RepID=A0A364K778_9BACL|nr:PTS cellobiose transporter subunit IIC [Thermoflavimicrobium daqui]RAL26062.1 PTS cellobiose transporter subunit IIC [Thermoflavimicrobium daqui]
MNRFIQALEKHFVPIAGKIGSQRHLVAIRDGFVLIMPLIIIASFAVLINGLPIEAFQKAMASAFGETWKQLGSGIWNGSFAILAILVGIGVSYNLAKSYQVNAISAAVLSFGSTIIFVPPTKDASGLTLAWLGAQGLFVSILIAIIVTELYRRLVKVKSLAIKMPKGVPDGVARSFADLLPATIIFILMSAINLIINVLAKISLFEIIFNTIQKPLTSILSSSLPSAIIVAILIHLLWSFGLHGTNILGPIMDSVYLPALEENIKAFGKGVAATDVPHTITKPFFDVFVHMGGAGTTLALIAAIFIVAKSQQYRMMGRLSGAPGLFNINEPVLFGLPIVLNPILIIPFILIPVVLTIITYLAISSGFVPKAVALVPWNVPPIISGYLVTGGAISGVILQVINFVIAVVLYLPFIKMGDNQAVKQQENAS